MSDAIRKPSSVPGETTLLWSADLHEAGTLYRVFFFILTQEWASCDPNLGLLRPQLASMGFQDWAQITFR